MFAQLTLSAYLNGTTGLSRLYSFPVASLQKTRVSSAKSLNQSKFSLDRFAQTFYDHATNTKRKDHIKNSKIAKFAKCCQMRNI